MNDLRTVTPPACSSSALGGLPLRVWHACARARWQTPAAGEPAPPRRGERHARRADLGSRDPRPAWRPAITKNLLPAAVEQAYPGSFQHLRPTVGGYGDWATWPGTRFLAGWRARYLLLGKTRLVLDYFDFVRASQRKDGKHPVRDLQGQPARADGGYLNGLKNPARRCFTYEPPARGAGPAPPRARKNAAMDRPVSSTGNRRPNRSARSDPCATC